MENPPIKFESHNPKARKEYRCCGCGGRIPKGTRYRRDSGLWREGGFGDYKIHEECWLVMNMLEEYCYGNHIFHEAFEQDWLWHYSPMRYRYSTRRGALCKVYKMLRRVDPEAAKKIYRFGKSARENNRRWATGGVFGKSREVTDKKDGTALAGSGI